MSANGNGNTSKYRNEHISRASLISVTSIADVKEPPFKGIN